MSCRLCRLLLGSQAIKPKTEVKADVTTALKPTPVWLTFESRRCLTEMGYLMFATGILESGSLPHEALRTSRAERCRILETCLPTCSVLYDLVFFHHSSRSCSFPAA